MKIISFAWTTPALLADPPRKTVTRRNWKPEYAKRCKKGDLVAAYDKVPFHGGKHVATIQLTQDVYPEWSFWMPDEDYEVEGFAFFEEHPELLPPGTRMKVNPGRVSTHNRRIG